MTDDTQIESMVTITGAEYVRLTSEIERLRAALKGLRELADKERRNTAQLLSYPPQSSAAWNIRNAIDAVLGGDT